MKQLLYYTVVVLGAAALGADALAFSEPTKRQHVGEMNQPVPTAMMDLLELRRLGKRQESVTDEEDDIETATLTIAPDETCGFLSGSPGNGITCPNGALCTWEVKSIGAVICGRVAHLRCLNSAQANDPDICNDVCQSNEFNLLCTDASLAYCRTYAFPEGIRDYRCASTSVTAAQSVSFTYDGQRDPGFETTVLVLGDTSTAPEAPSKPGSTGEDDPPSSRSTTTVVESSQPSESTDGGGDDDDDDGPNIGAIVGGTIGGFTVLSLTILGAIWLRKKKQNSPPPPPPPGSVAPPVFQPAVVQQAPPVDTVPPMSAYFGKPVVSPTQSEWRDSVVTAPVSSTSPVSQAPLSSASPVSHQDWPGQSHPPGVQPVACPGPPQNGTYLEMSGEQRNPQS
ncbi:hypothetical protein ACJ41O_013731 [Fusarium nematophilum]